MDVSKYNGANEERDEPLMTSPLPSPKLNCKLVSASRDTVQYTHRCTLRVLIEDLAIVELANVAHFQGVAILGLGTGADFGVGDLEAAGEGLLGRLLGLLVVLLGFLLVGLLLLSLGLGLGSSLDGDSRAVSSLGLFARLLLRLGLLRGRILLTGTLQRLGRLSLLDNLLETAA